jgi:hypothetical protein
MRLAFALLLLLLLAHADWAKTLDTECRCEHAFPIKPSDSTTPSPWSGIAARRSFRRPSGMRSAVPVRQGAAGERIHRVDRAAGRPRDQASDVCDRARRQPCGQHDADDQTCMSYLFTDAPIGRPLDDNPAKLVIDASYKPPAKR